MDTPIEKPKAETIIHFIPSTGGIAGWRRVSGQLSEEEKQELGMRYDANAYREELLYGA